MDKKFGRQGGYLFVTAYIFILIINEMIQSEHRHVHDAGKVLSKPDLAGKSYGLGVVVYI